MKHTVRKLFAGLLALCMLFSAVPAVSADAQYSTQDTAAYAEDESVRVSIVLDAAPALEQYADAGSAAKDIAIDDAAQAYQDSLLRQQQKVADAISKKVLGGEPLDVVWNLTLVSNTISANVPAGAIDAIRQIPGVSQVLVEPLCKGIEQSAASSSTSVSASAYAGQMGTVPVYEKGYKGAGMRIAILDTGIDPDHQSFDGRAFAYALKEDYGEDYATELNLLTADEIRSKWSKLHISNLPGVGKGDIETIYHSEKLPFNYNYPDHIADASHDHDNSGAHGSHVAGIAGANRYIFLSPEDTTPVVSAEKVMVQGVAPDAQLLALKIIGTSGGAYPSDQFAAIEDALVLGADAINLSIGTDWAGFSYSTEYQSVLDRLQQTDTVVTIAAGNYGSTINKGVDVDMLRIEDVNLNTICDPGSFTNAFTVASTESNSNIGSYFTVNGSDEKIFYWAANKGEQLITLASENAYPYVYLDSVGVVGNQDSANADEATTAILENQLEALNNAVTDGLKGKVVIMNRGSSTFSDKASAAAALGAIAVIVVNNEEGSVTADLQNYPYMTVPVATVDLDNKENMTQNTAYSSTITAQHDSLGNAAADTKIPYYTGTLTIASTYGATEGEDTHITMSGFSAWGIPGSLELKPEITAPGGNIFSVDGASADGKGYTALSGTSMATAQAAGLAALVTQYAKANGLKEETGLTYRTLTQSLLMSTATPLREEDGRYYPILQQGAGLANAANAISAPSYITVSDQPDGKVKVELKDDPDRKGSYSATFTIHNLTDQALEYTVGADLFTQDIETVDGETYLSNHTTTLQANVTVNGGAAPAKVSVPAGGEATVTVSMALTDAQKAALNSSYPNGAYIQAFINVNPTAADGVNHSIPVLGFYGNWTDPSMYDSGYCPKAYSYGGITGLTLNIQSEARRNFFVSNPYGIADHYKEDRNTFDPTTDVLNSCYFIPMRTYSKGRCIIKNAETGEIYDQEEIHEGYALFYNDDSSYWGNTGAAVQLDWLGTDAKGNKLPEGTVVSIEVTLAPEYYRTADGSDVNWNALGKGATISTTVTIDCTPPEILNVDDSTLEDGYITVTVQDNEYVGMVSLYLLTAMSEDDEPLGYTTIEPDEPGKPVTVKLPVDPISAIGKDLALRVGDYAGHITTFPLGSIGSVALASPEVSLLTGNCSAKVDEEMAEDLLRQIKEDEAKGVVIAPQTPIGEDISVIDVAIPCNLLPDLESAGIANIRILTPLATVTIPKADFAALSADQGDVWVSLSRGADSLHMELSANSVPMDSIPAGIQLQASQESCTLTTVVTTQTADGNFKIIPSSVANPDDGTVTFTFSGSGTVYFLNNEKTFSDVPATAWYANGVAFAASHELVSGTGGNLFAPTANITRASIATLLYNMELEPNTGHENPFTDVAAGFWYETPVAWAAVNSIISGNGTGGFSPNLDITREQLAVFLYNYAKFCGIDVSAKECLGGFADQNAVSSWARPAMNWAVSNGLLHGVGANKLLPGGTATRAEVAVLMMNYVQFLAGVSLGA